MSYVSFGEYHDGYDYSYRQGDIPKYCEHCGITVKWYPATREDEWKKFDTSTGKKYLYEMCLCPTDSKRMDLKKAKKRNATFLERVWLKMTTTEPTLHVGYGITTPYFRRYAQSNLDVIEEAQHGT